MSLQGHYQNAYVTHDLEQAMALLGERFGVRDYRVLDVDMVLKTPAGDKPSSVRVAIGWAGDLQIELIQPVAGYVEPYLASLPADPADAVPRLHHVAVRRDDLAAMREEAGRMGLPLAFESEGGGLACIFLDARQSLGHYLEFVWATPEGWAFVGWPGA
jgi:hypothetical protein